MDRNAIEKIAQTYVRTLHDNPQLRRKHWTVKNQEAFVDLVNATVKPPEPLTVADLPTFRDYVDQGKDNDTRDYAKALQALAVKEGLVFFGNGPGPGHGRDELETRER